MIRINLLGEKEDHSTAYALHLLSFVGVFVVTCAVCSVIYFRGAFALDDLRNEKSQLQTQLTALQRQTAKVQELEQKRKVLREKLMTIARLKTRKHGPVHVLDDLNIAVPDRAWLTSLVDKGAGLEISGIALDDITVSGFMFNLEQSHYFSPGTELIQSAEEEVNGVKMKRFSMLARLKDALGVKKTADAGEESKSTGSGKTGKTAKERKKAAGA